MYSIYIAIDKLFFQFRVFSKISICHVVTFLIASMHSCSTFPFEYNSLLTVMLTAFALEMTRNCGH